MPESPRAAETLTPESVRDMASGFQHSRILLTAFELGLFTVLGSTGQTSARVARSLATDPRATDRLMNALCALDLLEKSQDIFTNTPIAAQFLVQGQSGYMAGLGHTVHLWHSWSTLTEAVRMGSATGASPIDDRGEEWLNSFIQAMHARARSTAPDLIAHLDLAGVSRVLDVGGGSGVYSMAFVRAGDHLAATVFDLPNVIPLTEEYVERDGLSDSIDTVVGNYSADPLPQGYDLVFLSAIIHSNSPRGNADLIRKCAASLNPGGQVVVVDFIMDEDRTSPPFAALFALNMLVGTREGDTYTEAEVRAWMEHAGLSDVVRQDTHLGTTIVTGSMPPS